MIRPDFADTPPRPLTLALSQVLSRLQGVRPPLRVSTLPPGLSGAFLGLVEDDRQHQWLFKAGSPRMIRAEVDNTRRWNALEPGIARVIYQAEDGSFLAEFCEGQVLEALFSEADIASRQASLAAFQSVLAVLGRVWEKTATPAPADPQPESRLLLDLKRRLPGVFQRHPGLKLAAQLPQASGSRTLWPLLDLLVLADAHPVCWMSPVHVWTHGDFNLSNIVISQSGAVRLIDLHRSDLGDPVTDLATLALSVDRLPYRADGRAPVPPGLRLVLLRQLRDFGQQFADEWGDPGFLARWHLGLARYALTACRLFADPEHAQRLFRKGHWHLDRALRLGALL